MSSGTEDDPLFGCQGFGLVEMPPDPDNPGGGPSFGFYLSPTTDADGNETLGLKMGCCTDAGVCWIAKFTVHLERVAYDKDQGGTGSAIGDKETRHSRVAIIPCRGHCRIPGVYENNELQPVMYKPPSFEVPDVFHAIWLGDGAKKSITIEHGLESSEVIAICSGEGVTQEFICRPVSKEKAEIYTEDDKAVPEGLTVGIELRRGKTDKKTFTWSGTGLESEFIATHGFNSKAIRVRFTMQKYPDEVVDLPYLQWGYRDVDGYNSIRVWAKSTSDPNMIKLPTGFVFDIEVSHDRAMLPEEQEEDDRMKLRLSHSQFSWGGTRGMSEAYYSGEFRLAQISNYCTKRNANPKESSGNVLAEITRSPTLSTALSMRSSSARAYKAVM
jgi:hypothetical protein